MPNTILLIMIRLMRLIVRETLNKKWNLSLKVSSVNATKSEVFCSFGHVYWRKP